MVAEGSAWVGEEGEKLTIHDFQLFSIICFAAWCLCFGGLGNNGK